MKNLRIDCLETKQNEKFKIIYSNKENEPPEPPDLDVKSNEQKEQNFFSKFDEDKTINKLKSLDSPLSKKNEPETYEYGKKFPKINILKLNNEKILNLTCKKRKRSPKEKFEYITTDALKNIGSRNSSRNIPSKKFFKIKVYENVSTNINVIQTKKEEELSIIFTQTLSNQSTESTELKESHLSNEKNQVSIRAEMDRKIISFLGEAHEMLDKDSKKDALKTNLENFLGKKKWKQWGYHMIKKNNLNQNEETEISPLDYYNILISKIKQQIPQIDENDILVKQYHLINIFKNQKRKKPKKNKNKRNNNIKNQIEEKENLNVEIPRNELSGSSDLKIDKLYNFYDSEEEIKKENRKSNLSKIIKNRILNGKMEDFKEISELYEPQKIEYIQSKEKDNNETESDFNFFKNNFESYFEELDKIFITDENLKEEENEKEYFDDLNKITKEKNLEDDLIKISGKDHLDKKMNEQFEKFVEKDKITQQIKYKREKCRNKLYQIYQSNNFERLLSLSDQFYIEKKKDKKIGLYIKIHHPEEFGNRIRKIEGYNNFKLELSKRENEDIQYRANKFVEIFSDSMGYLSIPKKKKNLNELNCID